ncbi:hypothetical protein DW829_00405 [Phocaeicola vulgatus]|jgi:hypothetical protein|uniref:Uncharacterized protein n=1 Tax=Phocaeicola vulgatus TaxID=821 RepID=A0A412NWV0_PHOVU|nr:hypothetical protein DWX35_05485 [Phocaeicola vulgatus]RJU58143.1 hypothetical protein DW710_11885 [Bacteroides sp. AM27-13]RHC67323.1 hypothetical protein DW837_07955 [Phocaeicola vulgatus]RHC82740.1 hypothetical protein DW829_00405 [Phocaeicola vulgatus]RHI91346.1 hypothetical protein DW150_10000 [Phocaeicola vulgatus]
MVAVFWGRYSSFLLHLPLKLPVIFLHLASPFFPVKGEESTAETEMRGDFLAINKLITSVF